MILPQARAPTRPRSSVCWGSDASLGMNQERKPATEFHRGLFVSTTRETKDGNRVGNFYLKKFKLLRFASLMNEILVIGHRNPDTDSICSAIGYAEFKRRTGMPEAVAARCGAGGARHRACAGELLSERAAAETRAAAAAVFARAVHEFEHGGAVFPEFS